jgi:hypothetical protein
MMLTYSDTNGIPSRMHLFYEQAYETLFYRHDAWKDVGFQRVHYCDLAIDEFKRVLATFCMASYKKSIYKFTLTSILTLIKQAADFERIDLKQEEFLKDLVESVCILQNDGLEYSFTHRSFQEYFAAAFICQDPAVPLLPLIDSIAVRRSDAVIPMAAGMNRTLIERLWVIPRIQELVNIAPQSKDDLLKFGIKLFGRLQYDGRRSQYRVIEGPDYDGQMLHSIKILQNIYEGELDIAEVFRVEEAEIGAIAHFCHERAEAWWDMSWAKLATLPYDVRQASSSWPNSDADFRQIGYDLTRTFDANPSEAELGADRSITSHQELSFTTRLHEQFVSKCRARFDLAATSAWELCFDRDGDWFRLTSASMQLERLGEQIRGLRDRLAAAAESTRRSGTRLFDEGFDEEPWPQHLADSVDVKD